MATLLAALACFADAPWATGLQLTAQLLRRRWGTDKWFRSAMRPLLPQACTPPLLDPDAGDV